MSGLLGLGRAFRRCWVALPLAAVMPVLLTACAKPNAPAPEFQKGGSTWVKLCEHANVADKGRKERAEICLTHHERIDGRTGGVVISVAVRRIEGRDGLALMAMVPPGFALKPGMRIGLYSQRDWEKAQRNERVDDADIETISLPFGLCSAQWCSAEVAITPQFLQKMRSSAGLMALAINLEGKPIAFLVPLAGFAETDRGPPVDTAQYRRSRQELMADIRDGKFR